MTNNDLQNITQNTKDRTTGTPLIPGDDIKFCERAYSSRFTSDTRRASDKRQEHHLIFKSC
jgi:CRISPR/Cas system CMR subunit Cmr6 (Cas7 group RAMP superfamily)